MQAIARRRVLTGLAALFAASALHAQEAYPSRPIKMLVGYAPASGADVVARLVASKLGESLKQTVVVENKAGAGGVIAAQELMRAPADGYSLMLAAMPQMIISAAANPKLPFNPLRDFAPVAQVVSVDLVLVVNPQKVAATSFKDFIAHAQQQPINFFGTPGPGSVGHFLATMFADSAKAKVEPVHFKATGDSLTALVGGEIHALFVSYPVAVGLAKSGKVRALAVTAATRSPIYPDAPTMREIGHVDLEAGSWYGVFAPANTPTAILDKLSAEILAGARTPEMRAKFDEAGLSLAALNRDEFARGMKDDLARWDKVVKASGFTLKD